MAFPAVFHAALAAAIPAMTTAGGRHNNYGPANVARPSQWVLPQALFSFAPEALRSPQRLNAFDVNLPLAIRVICPAPVAPATLQDVCDGVIQDFKSLLKALEVNEPLRNAGLLRVIYVNAPINFRLVAAAPAEVTLNYTIWYRQMPNTL